MLNTNYQWNLLEHSSKESKNRNFSPSYHDNVTFFRLEANILHIIASHISSSIPSKTIAFEAWDKEKKRWASLRDASSEWSPNFNWDLFVIFYWWFSLLQRLLIDQLLKVFIFPIHAHLQIIIIPFWSFTQSLVLKVRGSLTLLVVMLFQSVIANIQP